MEIEMPVLLAYAIEDSTDIFRISGGGGVEHPKPPLGTPLAENSALLGYYVASTGNSRPSTHEVFPEGCRHGRGITTTHCIITQKSAVLTFTPIF